MVRHVIPDDRLAHVTFTRGEDDDLLVFAYRAWHIEPVLVQDMGALSSAVASTGAFELDPERLECKGPPKLEAWFELVPGDLMAPDKVMDYRVVKYDHMPAAFEIQCRAECVDPALIRELNEEVLPPVCGALVPVKGQVV